MLLIGDIHINARHSQAIIDQITDFIKAHNDETNIVFLGDYMYMFSYDRLALSQLFDVFLGLRGQGKHVYILGGNHDWLTQHFVYQEGKKVADILNKQAQNKLHFITEPEIHNIEGKDILFMPFNKGFLNKQLDGMRASGLIKHNHQSNDGFQSESIADQEISDTASQLDFAASTHTAATPYDQIKLDTLTLLNSTNINEQLSGALNSYVLEKYKPGMVLIHHYYTAQVRFPGQDAIFDYKDIALHPLRTKYADRIISGHIHKAFMYENYMCTGSIRYTTSGERDHCKRLWSRNTNSDTFTGWEISINPYYKIQSEEGLTPDAMFTHILNVSQNHKSLFSKETTWSQNSSHDLGKSTILLYTQQSVNDIEQKIDPTLKEQLGDIQFKQVSSGHKDMTELLDISQYNVKQSLLDWKELVKKYLMSRYGTESEKYRTLLSELNIL